MPPEPEHKTIRARELRQAPTPAEAILWGYLRSRQLKDAKFRRQMAVGPYFADFACPEFRCIIEIDGASHEVKELYDKKREEFLEMDGWTVIRFTEAQVHGDLEGMLEAVGVALDDRRRPPHPTLSHHRNGGEE